ncbi:hypothetical protein C8R43DRAFT_957387 [Mycena crocata]|nr:hypothetical protein C8R43DRAFT_957387 [Mycena crocata]
MGPNRARTPFFQTSDASLKGHMATASIIGALSLTAATYLITEQSIRNILAVGAAVGSLPAVFTVVFLRPLNGELIATLRAHSSKSMEPRDGKHVMNQLDKWRYLNKVRQFIAVIP